MKRNKDWTDVMRSKLREAEVQPSGQMWARLERELGAAPRDLASAERQPTGRDTRRIALPLRRWSKPVAAAAALVLMLGGVWWLHDRFAEVGETLPAVASETPGEAVARRISADEQERGGKPDEALAAERRLADAGAVKGSAERGVRSHAAVEEHRSEAVGTAGAAASGPELSEVVRRRVADLGVLAQAETDAYPLFAGRPETAEPVRLPALAPGRIPGEQGSANTGRSRREERHKEPALLPEEQLLLADASAAAGERRRRSSIGAFASGGTGAQSEVGRSTYNTAYADLLAPVGNDVVFGHRFEYPECSFRHRQTLSFGLSFRYEFAHGLSLGTGLDYTLLRSDVKLRFSSEDVGQTLHFIGIPLRLDWSFFRRSGFLIYIGAGAKADKCVSARFGSTSVDEPGVQWSVNGAVGAQYNLGHSVGLYFEPDVSYYFNGTKLRTARTDSPLDFTLRMGVRFSF